MENSKGYTYVFFLRLSSWLSNLTGKFAILAVICQLWGTWKREFPCANCLNSEFTPAHATLNTSATAGAQPSCPWQNKPLAQWFWLMEACTVGCASFYASVLPFIKQTPSVQTPVQRWVLMLDLWPTVKCSFCLSHTNSHSCYTSMNDFL